MPETGHFETDDLSIAAALLSCNGAAWDGKDDLQPGLTGEALNGRKQLVVTLADSRMEIVNKVVGKPWQDPETGRLYHGGETAPMKRVVFVLDGSYRIRQASAAFHQPFTDNDWRFWLREFHRSDGMLTLLRGMRAQENILRNWMRDRHGVASKFKMRVSDGGGNG